MPLVAEGGRRAAWIAIATTTLIRKELYKIRNAVPYTEKKDFVINKFFIVYEEKRINVNKKDICAPASSLRLPLGTKLHSFLVLRGTSSLPIADKGLSSLSN